MRKQHTKYIIVAENPDAKIKKAYAQITHTQDMNKKTVALVSNKKQATIFETLASVYGWYREIDSHSEVTRTYKLSILLA